MHRLLANLSTPNQMLAYQNFTNCWWVWRVNCAPWAPSRLSALPIIDTRVTSLHVYTSYLSSICAWRTSHFLRSCARVFTLINRHLTHLCFVLLQIPLCLLAFLRAFTLINTCLTHLCFLLLEIPLCLLCLLSVGPRAKKSLI